MDREGGAPSWEREQVMWPPSGQPGGKAMNPFTHGSRHLSPRSAQGHNRWSPQLHRGAPSGLKVWCRGMGPILDPQNHCQEENPPSPNWLNPSSSGGSLRAEPCLRPGERTVTSVSPTSAEHRCEDCRCDFRSGRWNFRPARKCLEGEPLVTAGCTPEENRSRQPGFPLDCASLPPTPNI